MPLKKLDAESGLQGKSIVLFSLLTSNEYKPSFQPLVNSVTIVSTRGEKNVFKVARYNDFAEDSSYYYLINADLPSGDYMITSVKGGASNLLVSGGFNFLINVKLTAMKDKITYIGHINMNNRERIGDEPRSGIVFPNPLGQALTGFAGGTFDVTISDSSKYDIDFFRKEYPVLKNQEIGVNIGTR